MKPNYCILRNNIPSKLRTKSNISFDVLWQDDLKDTAGPLYGITNFNPNQIILNTQLSDKEAVSTYFHEAIHAFADIYDIKLTEKEVLRFEKSFQYWREFFLVLEGRK